MPIRTRNVAVATITIALTAAFSTVGLAPASAAPADCTTVETAKDAKAVDCIATIRLRAEAATRKAALAEEAYHQAQAASDDATDQAEALRLAAEHAERVAVRSRTAAATVAASLARGGGSVGQTTEVLLSGEGAGSVLYNLSRVSALTEDTSQLAADAKRDSDAAAALETQAGRAADRASVSAHGAKATFDDAKKSAEAALLLVQQTESKQDQAATKVDSAKYQAAYVDLPADASTAAKVVAFARAQIGEPYVFAAAGPSSWDCSGLTMMAFQSVGIAIGGHGATVQYTTARSKGLLVPYAQAQPGDLLFWGSGGDMEHVAVYSGGGKMIEAPHPGASVREVPVRTGGMSGMVARYTG